MAWILPLAPSVSAVPSGTNMVAIWPPIRSTNAGAEPLYGMCVICTPVRSFTDSMIRWWCVPLPGEP